MTGEIEDLRQAQHQRAHRVHRAADRDHAQLTLCQLAFEFGAFRRQRGGIANRFLPRRGMVASFVVSGFATLSQTD